MENDAPLSVFSFAILSFLSRTSTMNTIITEERGNKATYYWVAAIALFILVFGGIYLFKKTPPVEILTTEAPSATSNAINPYGSITLKLGETRHFRGISITPLRIETDSRCAQGVQCVWAGTVEVAIRSDLASGDSPENIVTLGKEIIVDTFSVKLNTVTPDMMADKKITSPEYRLTFEVHQSSVVDTELIGK